MLGKGGGHGGRGAVLYCIVWTLESTWVSYGERAVLAKVVIL